MLFVLCSLCGAFAALMRPVAPSHLLNTSTIFFSHTLNARYVCDRPSNSSDWHLAAQLEIEPADVSTCVQAAIRYCALYGKSPLLLLSHRACWALMILRFAKASATEPFCLIWNSDVRSICCPNGAPRFLKHGSSSTLVLRLSLATVVQS